MSVANAQTLPQPQVITARSPPPLRCLPLWLSSTPLTSIKPYSARHCTDVLFVLLFAACWAAVGYMASLALTRGDPTRLSFTHGTDMNGSVCGVSESVLDRPYAAWPFPTEYAFMICVADCSATLNDTDMALPLLSRPVLHYCMPDAAAVLNVSALNLTAFDPDNPYLQSATSEALMAIGDIVLVYPVILGSAGLTVVLSFAWLFVLQAAAGALINALLALVLAGGALSGYALLHYADSNAASDPALSATQVHLMQYTAYALLGITAVLALIIIALRKRIAIAVQVVKEASRAMSAMRSIVLFPAAAHRLLRAVRGRLGGGGSVDVLRGLVRLRGDAAARAVRLLHTAAQRQPRADAAVRVG